MVTKRAPVRRQASQADQAGARERACTMSTSAARIRKASRAALRQMRAGFLDASFSVMCVPPARSTAGTRRPPALATRAEPPARTIACTISTVPRSTPPVSSAGRTCSTVRRELVGHAARAIPPHAAGGRGEWNGAGSITARAWSWPGNACRARAGVVFLPGFRSDMTGDKATALAALCRARGQALLLFDYSGHGASGGAFTDGTIGRWTADALAAIDGLTEGRLVLVGSSMGGWIGLLAALARPDRVAGFVGVAAAPDFTEALMWETMMPAERATLERDGVLQVPSAYGEPTPITRALIEEGRDHLLLGAPIALPARCGCCTARRMPTCRGRCRCAWPGRSRRRTCRCCW